ncbi:hypothetical protein [Xylanimonas ulmi]|uniref:SH3 domain-containing protein n=1 Tax=Xylanimonas ulmi TaxID=228973 RepID=A0A4Q7LYN8_9MICO|nr:hypothetical protein [Xylanibacterium ulmi]RZS60396.1 hypothetical protein EV386_0651 [Xylanibacterium ulmi]
MTEPAPLTHVVIESDPQYDDPAPIRILPGQVVTVTQETATEFPAFVHVTTPRGEGWVPRRHLDGARPAAAVLRAYDTTVLMPQVGDRVAAVEEDTDSGWTWCRDQVGREGWVMTRALRPLSVGGGRINPVRISG